MAKYVNKSSRLLIVDMYNIFKGRTKILDNYKKVGRKGITLSQECYNSGHLAGWVDRGCSSWFWGFEFRPQVGDRDYLKIKS